MSFLFQPVSAAINTLKLIKSASDKGPDPNRFVTRVPPNPGKWALGTAYKRKHNLWKWTHYLPATVPRKEKTHEKRSIPPELKITRRHPGEALSRESQLEEPASEAPPSASADLAPPTADDTDRSRSQDVASTYPSPDAQTSEATSKRKSPPDRDSVASSHGSGLAEQPLDEDGMPYFPIPDDEEAENEARRLAEMSPEQRVYHRSCEHFKVKASRQVMKQIDSVEMNMAHIKMKDNEFKAFTAGLVMNFSVKRMNLSDTMLSEREMTYLNDFLEDDNGITDLLLKDNRLEGRSVSRMFESMRIRDVMVYLDISGNNLRDKDIPILASYIESSSQLNFLHIARNKFTSKAGEALGKMMTNATLLDLNMSCNHIRGDGMIAFLNGVARNGTLERLDISWNGIGPEAVKALANLFRMNSSIINIDLTGTRLNGECLDIMVNQGLMKNSVLQRIVLKNNPLLTLDLTTLLHKLVSLPSTSLRRVDLGDYQMLESGVTPILEQLFWERNIDVRYGSIFTFSKHVESVEKIVYKHRQDALSLVTRLTRDQRAALVKHFGRIDLEEAVEQGTDIQAASFLGRVNENRVTYKDLALRLELEGGNIRDVIQGALEKEEIAEGSKQMVSRFTLTPEDVRRLTLFAKNR